MEEGEEGEEGKEAEGVLVHEVEPFHDGQIEGER